MRRGSISLLLLLVISVSSLSCYERLKNANPWKAPDMTRHMPASWEPTRVKDGAVRTARIRVYADHELRAQSPSWNRQFSQWVDNANQVLIPEFGVQLEVIDFQEWTRQTSSDDLAAMLKELEERDSGADVEWVVGLVAALSRVTPSVHELGMARSLGRHMVIRGHSDLAERKALARLDVSEDFFEARKLHKQTSVLLHEIGHTLGGLHVASEERALLYPAYSKHYAGFNAHNVRVMEAVLEERLREPERPSIAREARALAKTLGDEPWTGWAEEEFQEMRAWLAAAAEAGFESGAGTGAVGSASAGDAQLDEDGIPEIARTNFARVQGLTRHQQYDAAWAELENLMAAYPANIAFREFACGFWIGREGPGERAQEHCERVGELAPDNPAGDIALATAYIKNERPVEAHAALLSVLARLSAMPSEADRQAAFDAIVSLYQVISGVTYIEEAVAQAPADVDTQAARAFVAATRRRYGLPPDGARHGITPEREGEYVRRVHAVLEATYGKRYNEARKLARAGLRDFENGPGFSGALCDLEYRRKAYAAAHGYCATALRYYGEASWSRYLMGILELRKKRNRAGIGHLKKAIESDPDLRQAYHALYQAYARVKDQAAQSELRALYYERFGVPLPAR